MLTAKIGDNIGPLLGEGSHLTNKDVDKTEMFNVFTSVFNINDEPRDPRCPELARYSESWLISLQDLSQLFFSSLGNLKSQSTKSSQMLFQVSRGVRTP